MKVKVTQFPCVKGTMGDWTYYLTLIGATEIVKYVQYAEQVCPNVDLDLMIQREVTARSHQIAEYLRHQPQRFFGSLIIAAYNGKPNFRPVSFGETSLLAQLEGTMGILQFDGSEQYYAVDGQHRLAALKDVVKEDGERYRDDQISVIVICHTKDAEGMARARRLFTTVNRYAKKTAPVTNIVMDEDDGVALITRRLIREHDFFSRRIKVLASNSTTQPRLAKGEAMQSADSDYLMAIGTFYKCNKALLPEELKGPYSRAQQIPAYEQLEDGFEKIKGRWDELISVVTPWKFLQNPEHTLRDYRIRTGGNVLVRPVGIASFVRASADALESKIALRHIGLLADRFADLASPPWDGVLWNAASHRMIAGKYAENLATRLWRYLLGLQEDKDKLQEEWKASIDPRNEHPDLALPARLRQ